MNDGPIMKQVPLRSNSKIVAMTMDKKPPAFDVFESSWTKQKNAYETNDDHGIMVSWSTGSTRTSDLQICRCSSVSKSAVPISR